MEIKILQTLGWKLNYVVPFEYLCLFSRLFPEQITENIFEITLEYIEICLFGTYIYIHLLTPTNKKIIN